MNRLIWHESDLTNFLRADVQAGVLAGNDRSSDYVSGWMSALHLLALQLGLDATVQIPPRVVIVQPDLLRLTK